MFAYGNACRPAVVFKSKKNKMACHRHLLCAHVDKYDKYGPKRVYTTCALVSRFVPHCSRVLCTQASLFHCVEGVNSQIIACPGNFGFEKNSVVLWTGLAVCYVLQETEGSSEDKSN